MYFIPSSLPLLILYPLFPFFASLFHWEPPVFFGVVIFSVNIILAHYFAGIGKFSINTISSCIGLIITVLCCFPFIHLFKGIPYLHVLIIVSLVTSISYFCSFVFTFVCFIKQTKTKFKEFLILKEDISIVLQELKKILHR